MSKRIRIGEKIRTCVNPETCNTDLLSLVRLGPIKLVVSDGMATACPFTISGGAWTFKRQRQLFRNCHSFFHDHWAEGRKEAETEL